MIGINDCKTGQCTPINNLGREGEKERKGLMQLNSGEMNLPIALPQSEGHSTTCILGDYQISGY